MRRTAYARDGDTVVVAPLDRLGTDPRPGPHRPANARGWGTGVCHLHRLQGGPLHPLPRTRDAEQDTVELTAAW
jgi:hypothetical protein